MDSNFTNTPQAIEIEKSVIGTLLLFPESMTSVVDALGAEHFYDPLLAQYYATMVEMYDSNLGIDLYTVSQRCKLNPLFKKTNILVELIACTQMVGSGANLGLHVSIIRQKHLARELIKAGIKLTALAQSEDVDEAMAFISQQSDMLHQLSEGGDKPKPIASIIPNALDDAARRKVSHQDGMPTGIATGLSSLDALTGGWRGSQLVILAARPSMGKTALMLHFAKTAAKSGVPVCLFSLEMNDISLTNRLLLSECDVHPDKFRSGDLTTDDFVKIEQAGAALSKLPLTIDDSASISMRQVKARSKLLHKRGKCGMIMLDYLQLADTSSGNKNTIREQEVAQASRQAKIIAKELDIPVILLSQLSRKVEERGKSDKIPVLSDLRESGAIEQDADIVAFIYRPAYYGLQGFNTESELGEISTKGLGVLSVAKQRDGAIGGVLFSHNPSMTKITDHVPFDYHAKNEHDNEPF